MPWAAWTWSYRPRARQKAEIWRRGSKLPVAVEQVEQVQTLKQAQAAKETQALEQVQAVEQVQAADETQAPEETRAVEQAQAAEAAPIAEAAVATEQPAATEPAKSASAESEAKPASKKAQPRERDPRLPPLGTVLHQPSRHTEQGPSIEPAGAYVRLKSSSISCVRDSVNA